MKSKIFLICLLMLMLIWSCKSPLEPDSPTFITIKVRYERMNSVKTQGDDVRFWFTVFVGEAQYGWYCQPLIKTGTSEYETTINYAQPGKWLFYVLDVPEEVGEKIFLNGVQIIHIVDGKGRAAISSTGYVSSGW